MKTSYKITAITLGALAYEIFFFQEKMGINTLFFFLVILIFLLVFSRDCFRSLNVIITGAATLLSSVLIVFVNSGPSKFAFISSLIVFIGFVFQPTLRSVLSAWSAGFINFFVAPFEMIWEINKAEKGTKKKSKFWQWFRLFIIPVVILLIFYWIFKAANPVFDNYTADMWAGISEFLESVFINFSWAQFFIFLLGLFIFIGVLYKSNLNFISESESKKKILISRNDIRKRNRYHDKRKIFALRSENRMGIILVALINCLLLIINIIDINWIWFDFKLLEGMDLKQLVHEGTYLLILSTLISMAIILFYFRANLNFYKKSKWLRYGVYAWIFQNMILAVSVAIRNFHYIDYFGLAYKRIGVLIFLVLTVIGLITIIIKILKKNTGFYMIKTNAWSVFFMMIFMSFFNWDIIITKHNLSHRYPQNMEADFLLRMSDKTLYILNENKEKFKTQPFLKNENSVEILENRINAYKNLQSERTIFSWNYPDSKSIKVLFK